MESNRTYRDTVASEIKLPKEVYYRCLWTVRDMKRLEKLASVLDVRASGKKIKPALLQTGETVQEEADPGAVSLVPDDVAGRAQRELKCISNALKKVPEVYREGLLDNIIGKEPFGDFAHPNTWKKWKLVFLYELARELRLI